LQNALGSLPKLTLDFCSRYIDHGDEYWEKIMLMMAKRISAEPLAYTKGVSIAEIEQC
jgi:hypothetical protein